MERLTAEFQERYVDSRRMASGATVVICSEGETAYRCHFGDHDGRTTYQILSITKLFTTVAILQLVDAGRVSLDDPVSKYLPSFGKQRCPVAGAAVVPPEAITIRHLLNHTSGLGYGMGVTDNSGTWTGVERAAVEIARQRCGNSIPSAAKHVDDIMAEVPLPFAPGSRFNYAGGHVVVGRVVEVVAGTTLARYVQEHITGPLGMHDTTFLPTREQAKRMAGGRFDVCDLDHPMPRFIARLCACLRVRSIPIPAVRCTREEDVRGDAGLVSTADDLTKFMQMLLRSGVAPDGRTQILSKAGVDAMCTSSLPPDVELAAPFAVAAVDGVAPRRPYFGALPEELPSCRYLNSYPGQTMGLGLAIVKDARRAGVHREAAGTCWWQGLSSTYLAVNRRAGIGCLVLANQACCGSRAVALADVLTAAHEMKFGPDAGPGRSPLEIV